MVDWYFHLAPGGAAPKTRSAPVHTEPPARSPCRCLCDPALARGRPGEGHLVHVPVLDQVGADFLGLFGVRCDNRAARASARRPARAPASLYFSAVSALHLASRKPRSGLPHVRRPRHETTNETGGGARRDRSGRRDDAGRVGHRPGRRHPAVRVVRDLQPVPARPGAHPVLRRHERVHVQRQPGAAVPLPRVRLQRGAAALGVHPARGQQRQPHLRPGPPRLRDLQPGGRACASPPRTCWPACR